MNLNLKNNKFLINIVWNYVSLFFLGISGITLNTIISIYYDPSVLGSFNQVLATYIVFSVLGNCGVSYSTLQILPTKKKNIREFYSIICGALFATFVTSLIFTFIYYTFSERISFFLQSKSVLSGMRIISVGLFFFSINKTLFGIINGLKRMKEFAIYQTLRYVLILLGLYISILYSINGKYLPFVFSFSESILFITLTIALSKYLKWHRAKDINFWFKRHLSFGIRSFSSSFLYELNSRIDILMIGLFLSDNFVGIYSFASLISEGLLQFLIVLQNNFNPIISELISNKKKLDLINLIKDSKKLIYGITIFISIISSLAYLPIMKLITNNSAYLSSYIPFIILIFGTTFSSVFIVFNNIFLMANKPLIQSYYVFTVVGTNILFNIILIPYLGINGAALGTCISTIISKYTLLIFAKKFLKINI